MSESVRGSALVGTRQELAELRRTRHDRFAATQQQACEPNPCMNGGACTAKGDGLGYTCSCKNAFTGLRCTDPPMGARNSEHACRAQLVHVQRSRVAPIRASMAARASRSPSRATRRTSASAADVSTASSAPTATQVLRHLAHHSLPLSCVITAALPLPRSVSVKSVRQQRHVQERARSEHILLRVPDRLRRQSLSIQ